MKLEARTWDDVLFDVVSAARGWRRRPSAIAIVLTLAMGIGAAIAVGTILHSIVWNSLAYPDPEELFVLETELPAVGQVRPRSSGPEFDRFRETSAPIENMGVIWHRPGALTDDASEPEEIDMGFVSHGFLDAVGVAPALGRWFLEEEDEPNAPKTILLSHELFRRRYGADRSLVGERIELDGQPHTVVGVMPEDFRMLLPPEASVPERLDAWVPWRGAYDELPASWRIFTIVGRLKSADEADFVEARTAMEVAASDLARELGSEYDGSGIGVRVAALERESVAHLRVPLLALGGAVVLVLLVAVANVSNLLLVKAMDGSREMAVRSALGASGVRRFRHRLIESWFVTIPGAVLGGLFGTWFLSFLETIRPIELSRLTEVALSWTAVGTAIALGVFLGVALSMVTTMMASGGIETAMHSLGRTRSGLSGSRLRRALVVGEIAICLVLLVGAGLLGRTFLALTAVEPGFAAERTWTVKVSLVDGEFPYREPRPIAEFYRELVQQLVERSGVEVAGASTELPFDGASYYTAPYAKEHATDDASLQWGTFIADYRTITPGYLEAMGAELVSGRTFEWSDDLDHPNVVVIDDSLARKHWPSETPIGKRIRVEYFRRAERFIESAEVIGVVRHLLHHPAGGGTEQVYLAHAQSPQRTMSLAVRSLRSDESLLESVNEITRSLYSRQPVHTPRRFGEYLSSATATPRFSSSLVSAFGLAAALLAAVGIYGVIAFGARLRTQSIGLCLALGATPRGIRKEILVEGAKLVASGVCLGIPAAALSGLLLRDIVFGISPWDFRLYIAVAGLLFAIGWLASFLPAHRASRLNPIEVLRAE